MVLNPLVRLLMLVLGVAFAGFGIRDAADSPTALGLGLGFALTILPLVAVPPRRDGAADVRAGTRELDGMPRTGTLLIPPRRAVAAGGLSVAGLAVVLAATTVAIAGSGELPPVVAVVPGALALLLALLAVRLLRRVARREDLALVLTPEGLGPVGTTRRWLPWEDVHEVRLDAHAQRSLLAPAIEIETREDGHHKLGPSLLAMPVADLLPTLQRLVADPGARRHLTGGDAQALPARQSPRPGPPA